MPVSPGARKRVAAGRHRCSVGRLGVLLSRFRPPMEIPLKLDYKGTVDVVTHADMASDEATAGVPTRSGVPGNIISEG